MEHLVAINFYLILQILNGMGIDDPAGYATLRSIPPSVDEIDFEFMSYQPSGILLYALISANPPVSSNV